LQTIFNATTFGKFQNALVPGFQAQQNVVTHGVVPSNFVDPGLAVAADAEAAAAAANAAAAAGGPAAGAAEGNTGGGPGTGAPGDTAFAYGGMVRRANGSPEGGDVKNAKSLMDKFKDLAFEYGKDPIAFMREYKVPTSPMGVGLTAGYAAYKHVTGKDPLLDLQKELSQRLNPEIDTGDTESMPISVGLPPVRRANGSPEEGEDLSKPSFGNPNIRKQGEAARRLAAMRDVNTLPDPKTYAAVAGALGTRPDQMGFSVLNPKYKEIMDVANPAFYAGTALQIAPVAQGPGMGRMVGAAERALEPAVRRTLEGGGKASEMLQALAAPPSQMFVRARPEAAARHADLQAKGLSPEQIRAQNLTLVDNRGNLLEEISDAPAVLQQKTASVPRMYYDMLKHPELQSIYPAYDMPDVRIGTTRRKDAPLAAASFGEKEGIQGTVRSLPGDDVRGTVRGTLLHEGQHAIQSMEGFTEGANPSSFVAYIKAKRGLYDADPTVNENVIREMERVYPNLSDITDRIGQDLKARYGKVFPSDKRMGEALYRHMPGEVQAELARVRSNLTPDELKATPLEVSMQQLNINPANILEMNKQGRRLDRQIGDLEYDVYGYAQGGPVYRAEGSPEEGEMSDQGSITVQEIKAARTIFPELPVTEAVYLLRGGQRQSTPQGEMMSGNIGARIPLGKDTEAMLMLAGSRPEGRQDSSKALLAMLNQRVGEGSVGAQMVRPMDAPAGIYAGGVSGSYPVGEGRVMGNVNMMRMPGQSPRVMDYGVGYGGQVGPGELSAMIMRQKGGPYSGQIQYRLPIGRAEGSPEEGEVAPRLTMQQIERLAAQEAAEREAASTPAFIAQKSGIGRKAGPVSQALQSGQGYVEAAKGFTMLPQNLVGGAFDISNMIANVYGGGVQKPIFGSENLKEQSRKAGLAFKPSDDPTLAAFFGAGDLGSNLVNPAGVTRSGVKAAQKTGEAVKGTASDLLAKYQATQAPKPNTVTDLMTGQQVELGGEDWIRQQFANIQAQRAANSTNVLGQMPRMQTPQTEPPIPVGWGEIDVTPGEVIDAQQALRAQRAEREAQNAAQNAQQQPQQLALPLEAPVEPPVAVAAPARKVTSVAPPVTVESAVTPSNPFVGRLDNFVATLKGPVTKEQLLGQIRGKFRDYDLGRVEQALEDLKPTDKIKPADLKQRLDNMFSPKNLRLGIVEPNPQAAGVHHLGMDNPFIDDKTKQMGIINLLMETPKEKLLAHRETADVDRAFAQFTGFNHLPEQIDLLKEFFVKSATPEKAAMLTADLDALVPYVQTFKEKQAILGDLENALYYPILSKKWGPAQNEFAQRTPDLWRNFEQYKPMIDEMVIQEGLKSMQVDFGIAPPPFSLYKQDKDAFNAAVKTALTPVNNEMAIARNNTQQAMAPIGKEIESLIQSKRLYKGQHPNLNEPYKQNNPVAFSRFTDHEAVIGDQGTKSGMYVHELQSDRFDDLIKKGPKGGSPEKDKKELIALNIQVKDKIGMPAHDGTPEGLARYGAEIGPASDRANIFNKAADAISIKSYDKDGANEKINALIATYPDQVDLIKDALKIAQRQKVLTGSMRKGSQAHQLEESFAGMETSPQVVQQLLAKNAIVAAMQRGKEFISFPGKESSQAQLYEKLPGNLKQVVKDLGPGFEIRPIELPVGDVDAINTLGVTWSPEAAARILKTGVPFNKGGMVERKADDNRRYM
jgi:hypothetical protein